MNDVPPEVLAVAALAALVVAVVQTARLALRSFVVRRRMRLRFARALAGEGRAADLLTRLGYAVVGRQVAVTYPVTVDRAVVPIDLRADYLVERGDLRFVAEVKTGSHAPRISTPSTRRQLLEYGLAFDVDGVLLVDVEAERVHAVVFPTREARLPKPRGVIAWLLAGAALGFAAAMMLRVGP